MKKYYIAYGSNMDEEQMLSRCPEAALVGKGMLHGYRLLFKGSGTGNYATIEKAEGGPGVPVLVWTISERDEASLDRYEGYPAFYYKTELLVKDVELYDGTSAAEGPMFHPGNSIPGMVYIMHEDRLLGGPRIQYLNLIAAAYLHFRMPMGVLHAALAYSVEHKGEVR